MRRKAARRREEARDESMHMSAKPVERCRCSDTSSRLNTHSPFNNLSSWRSSRSHPASITMRLASSERPIVFDQCLFSFHISVLNHCNQPPRLAIELDQPPPGPRAIASSSWRARRVRAESRELNRELQITRRCSCMDIVALIKAVLMAILAIALPPNY